MLYARYQGMHLHAPCHPADPPHGGILAQLPVYAAVIAVAILVAVSLSIDPQYVDQTSDYDDRDRASTTADPVFDGRGKWSGYAR